MDFNQMQQHIDFNLEMEVNCLCNGIFEKYEEFLENQVTMNEKLQKKTDQLTKAKEQIQKLKQENIDLKQKLADKEE